MQAVNLCSEKALEQRARRKARSVGLRAVKSRKRLESADNYGGFMLVDIFMNTVEAGERFDLSPEEVIAYCTE